MEKKEFLKKEIWLLSIGGAFQRANIYKSKEVSEAQKKNFRKELLEFVNQLILGYSINENDESTYVSNI